MRVVNQGAAGRLGRACCRAARAPLRPREVHVLDPPPPPFLGVVARSGRRPARESRQKAKIMRDNIIFDGLPRFP
mgnify:CR=1 FL=1